MKATIRKVAGRWQWECREDDNNFVVYGSCEKWDDALKVALDQLRNHYRWISRTREGL